MFSYKIFYLFWLLFLFLSPTVLLFIVFSLCVKTVAMKELSNSALLIYLFMNTWMGLEKNFPILLLLATASALLCSRSCHLVVSEHLVYMCLWFSVLLLDFFIPTSAFSGLVSVCFIFQYSFLLDDPIFFWEQQSIWFVPLGICLWVLCIVPCYEMEECRFPGHLAAWQFISSCFSPYHIPFPHNLLLSNLHFPPVLFTLCCRL